MIVLRGKCVVLGDCTVGKSSITQSFHSDGSSFPKTYNMTTGVDLIQKFIQLGENNQGMVDFFIFDSAGNEVFKDITEPNWDKLGMYVLVFDITNEQSFNNCKTWIKKLKPHLKPGKTVPGVLVGNKTDLEARRNISTEVAKKFAEDNSLRYFECSAKEYEGVEAPFRWLGERFLELYHESHDQIQELKD